METTIQQLLQNSIEQDNNKADYVVHPTGITFDKDWMSFSIGGNLFNKNETYAGGTPTDWAWRQLFSKLGPSVFGKGSGGTLPADYILALRQDLRSHVLNDHLKNYPNGDWMVRNYGDTCRAILSDKYAAISNTDMLDLLVKVSEKANVPSYITASSSVTPDSLNVRQIWKDVNRPGSIGGWGIGIAVTNGEIGNRKSRGLALIQRHGCQNSIVIDAGINGWEFTHRGSIATKMVVIKSVMQEILPFAAEMLERMINAQADEIPEFGDVLKGLAIHYGWDEDTATQVAIGTEGQQTRFGLVNGVTHAAKSQSTDDARLDMELLGGSILVEKDSLFSQARRLAKVE